MILRICVILVVMCVHSFLILFESFLFFVSLAKGFSNFVYLFEKSALTIVDFFFCFSGLSIFYRFFCHLCKDVRFFVVWPFFLVQSLFGPLRSVT